MERHKNAGKLCVEGCVILVTNATLTQIHNFGFPEHVRDHSGPLTTLKRMAPTIRAVCLVIKSISITPF
jgi:hypothetical protein